MTTQALERPPLRVAIVGLCGECNLYIEPYVPGQTCPGGCETATFGWPRIHRKRRVYICDEHETHPHFFTKKEADEHDCSDW